MADRSRLGHRACIRARDPRSRDIGHAWDADFDASDAIVSIGAELSLDAVIGFRLPLTFTGGAAWVSQDRGVSVFGRIGRAF